MNKKDLTERDICTKFITPAVKDAGWDVLSQIREQVYFTKGRIIVRGRLVTRGTCSRIRRWSPTPVSSRNSVLAANSESTARRVTLYRHCPIRKESQCPR